MEYMDLEYHLSQIEVLENLEVPEMLLCPHNPPLRMVKGEEDGRHVAMEHLVLT